MIVGTSENDGNDVELENGAQLFGQIIGAHFVLETQIKIVLWQKGVEAMFARTFVALEGAASPENVDPNVFFSTQSVDKFFAFAGGVAVADEPNDFDDLVAFDDCVVTDLWKKENETNYKMIS